MDSVWYNYKTEKVFDIIISVWYNYKCYIIIYKCYIYVLYNYKCLISVWYNYKTEKDPVGHSMGRFKN